ncbi:MAG: cytochrome c [Acidobacteriota bacterium]
MKKLVAGFVVGDRVRRKPALPGWRGGNRADGQQPETHSHGSAPLWTGNPRTSRARDDAAILTGMKLYRNDCEGCHGDRGRPSHRGTTGFYPRVPQLANQPPALTAPEMYLVVKNGIPYSGMGAWNGELSDSDIGRVAIFRSRIQTLPPAVDAWKAKS